MTPKTIVHTLEPEILEIRSLATVGGLAHEIRYRDVTKDAAGQVLAVGPEQRDTISAADGDMTVGQLVALNATLDAAVRNWVRRRYG